VKDLSKIKVGVVGLGYVGLPLAVSFAQKYTTFGFDVSNERIKELEDNYDRTLEISKSKLKNSKIKFFNQVESLNSADVFIVTVPTPVNNQNLPDLSALKSACKLIAKVMKKKSVIIFESTVYPGCTEEVCIPILRKGSKLILNKDFFVGYSPERINPGDKVHTFEKINKVVSGSNAKSSKFIQDLYAGVIKAEVFVASSIMVAEASKVIENTQRDINIALMNELSEIFNALDIKTSDVLKASATKWNFLKFRPGLVGGHCIGVDPYYLSYKSKQIGVNPRMILSGRQTNNKVVERIVNRILKKCKNTKYSPKILILGLSFKENCPDIRNSGSIKVIKELNRHGVTPFVHDPYFPKDPFIKKTRYHFIAKLFEAPTKYDGVLLLVPHKAYSDLQSSKIRKLTKSKGYIFDMTNSQDQEDFDSL